jgi:hypothetical protein
MNKNKNIRSERSFCLLPSGANANANTSQLAKSGSGRLKFQVKAGFNVDLFSKAD